MKNIKLVRITVHHISHSKVQCMIRTGLC